MQQDPVEEKVIKLQKLICLEMDVKEILWLAWTFNVFLTLVGKLLRFVERKFDRKILYYLPSKLLLENSAH